MNKKSFGQICVYIFGFLMLALAIAVGFAGYVNLHVAPAGSMYPEPVNTLLNDYYANISTEFFFAAITIFIIDALYVWRDAERLKQSLISDMGSDDNSTALRAVRRLRMHKGWRAKKSWLEDGSLREECFKRADLTGCDLHKADLQGASFVNAEIDGEANLSDANLRMADFTNANLRGADLRRADLRDADFTEADLRGANLTDALTQGAQFGDAELGDAV